MGTVPPPPFSETVGWHQVAPTNIVDRLVTLGFFEVPNAELFRERRSPGVVVSGRWDDPRRQCGTTYCMASSILAEAFLEGWCFGVNLTYYHLPGDTCKSNCC